MREQLVDIVLDAQSRQGCPGIDRSSIPDNAAHKAAVLSILPGCRPLPVVVA